MSLARTILEKNTDPSFVDNLIKIPSVEKNRELVELLIQGRDGGFSEGLLKYTLDGYKDIIKEAIQISYHPIVIKHLQEYSHKNGITHWNIANHPFLNPDMVYEFFAPYKKLSIEQDSIDELIKRSFTQNTMLLGSSFVYTDRDTIYFLFSKIRRNKPNYQGKIKLEFVEKGIESIDRKGVEKIVGYCKEKFPEHTLFEILRLNPDQIL